MAARDAIAAADRSRGGDSRERSWYAPDVDDVNEPFRRLLEEYAGIDGKGVVGRVNEIVGCPFSVSCLFV